MKRINSKESIKETHQYLNKYNEKENVTTFLLELGTREMKAQLPASSIMGVGILWIFSRQSATWIHKNFLVPELIYQ